MNATPQDLARSLIATSESTATLALCLADLDDSLRRCESDAERETLTRQTIRVYAGHSEGTNHHVRP